MWTTERPLPIISFHTILTGGWTPAPPSIATIKVGYCILFRLLACCFFFTLRSGSYYHHYFDIARVYFVIIWKHGTQHLSKCLIGCIISWVLHTYMCAVGCVLESFFIVVLIIFVFLFFLFSRLFLLMLLLFFGLYIVWMGEGGTAFVISQLFTSPSTPVCADSFLFPSFLSLLSKGRMFAHYFRFLALPSPLL